MSANSSTWRQNIIDMDATITTLDVNQNSSQQLVDEVTSFTTSITNYE